MAHLLAYDSVHGRLDAKVVAKDGAVEVNGKTIVITSEKDPANLRWKELGVDIACECTGLFTTGQMHQNTLMQGARKVIISAPATERTSQL